MKPRKTKELDKQLRKKGFVANKRDHTYYYLCYKGKKTSIYTKLSHSISEYSDNLLGQVARQLQLSNSELDGLFDCPFKYEDLIEKLKAKKILIL